MQNGSKAHRTPQHSRPDGTFFHGSDSEIVAQPVYRIALYQMPTVTLTVNNLAVETTLSSK